MTFLTLMLSKFDVITPMTSKYDYDVMYIIKFCDFNVTVTRLICMFIARITHDI